MLLFTCMFHTIESEGYVDEPRYFDSPANFCAEPSHALLKAAHPIACHNEIFEMVASMPYCDEESSHRLHPQQLSWQ